ncbi:MAG: aldo/keto reductase family protein [Myxococcota bacterium]
MRYRRLGQSGLLVSEVSLGSWLTLGSSVDQAATNEIVRRAFDLGINLFDTADVYARGGAELALREALAGISRHHVVIATKAFFPMSDRPNDRGLSRKHLFESVEGSLQRLGTDYLDLHQCHRADPDTPLEETVCAYEDLVRQGKVLYWGVSEWSAGQIDEACRIADRRTAYRPVSSQPQYSMLRREIEAAVLPLCERQGIGQIVWSPLAQGVLSGKYAAGQRPEGTRATDPERGVFMQDFLKDEVLERVAELRPLANELGVTLAQLALAWCLLTPGVSSVIVGVTRTSQLEENALACEIEIPAKLRKRIHALFPARGR